MTVCVCVCVCERIKPSYVCLPIFLCFSEANGAHVCVHVHVFFSVCTHSHMCRRKAASVCDPLLLSFSLVKGGIITDFHDLKPGPSLPFTAHVCVCIYICVFVCAL